MLPSWIQIAIIIFIAIGIGVSVFKSGQANPETTRSLRRSIDALGLKVGKIDSSVQEVRGIAVTTAAKVDQVERESVTAADIASLKELIEAKHDARASAMDETRQDVRLIKNFLMEKGLGGR
jgi:hypothetical protein